MFGRLLVLGMDDIDTAPDRGYLLKGVMSPNEVSVWVGAPKCGKSFLLMSIAYKLALGQSSFSCRVHASRILYVAAEGEGGIGKRLKALRAKYGTAPNFSYITQPIDLLHEDGHQNEVIAAATAVGAQLIIIDTLNRAIAGGNENSPEDMGTLITNISLIKAQTTAHIAVIHHGSRASEGRTPRGHSSLEGADDALIEVVKQKDGSRMATLVHSKDDADGMCWGFKLNVVELGQDGDGDQITTLVVEELDEPPNRVARPKAPPRLSDTQTVALMCFNKAMAEHAVSATVGPDHIERLTVTEQTWRTRFYLDAMPDEQQGTKKTAFSRAVIGLQSKGVIEGQNGFFWRPEIW